MIRPQRYWVVALKRAAITSITSRQTGNCSAIILADNSVSTIADDSSGSRKPAASPTATQLRFQKVSRRSEEHTSELKSLMRTSYDVFCLTTKRNTLNLTQDKT